MKKIIMVALLGMICSISITAQAKSTMRINQDRAAQYFIENYEELHIHPTTATGILTGESGAMTAKNNNGRPYGMIGHRYYDIISASEAFGRLIRYSGYYGTAWKQDTWQAQLYAIQSHHYCEGSVSAYVNYIESCIYRHNLDRYDKQLKDYLNKQEAKRKARARKHKQQSYFTVRYNPTLASWQVITDADIIKGGTIRIGFNWLDVIKTNKDIGQVIETGNRAYISGNNVVKLDEVIENAKG